MDVTESGALGNAPQEGKIGSLLSGLGSRTKVPFRINFADGRAWQNSSAAPAFTLTFNNAAAQRRTLLNGHVGLLEAYFDGGIDIDGDLAMAFRAGFDAGFDDEP